jgi:hypothetical protein
MIITGYSGYDLTAEQIDEEARRLERATSADPRGIYDAAGRLRFPVDPGRNPDDHAPGETPSLTSDEERCMTAARSQYQPIQALGGTVVDFWVGNVTKLARAYQNLSIGITALYNNYNQLSDEQKAKLPNHVAGLNALYTQWSTFTSSLYVPIVSKFPTDQSVADEMARNAWLQIKALRNAMSKLNQEQKTVSGRSVALAEKLNVEPPSIVGTIFKYGLIGMGVWFGGKLLLEYVKKGHGAVRARAPRYAR